MQQSVFEWASREAHVHTSFNYEGPATYKHFGLALGYGHFFALFL